MTGAPPDAAPHGPWPSRRVLLGAALLVLVYYLLLVGLGGVRLLQPVPQGLTFNSMAANLLVGRFDVDPAAIGDEAFVRDGRTYAYFGIFPALLRLPLMPFVDLSNLDVSRISIAFGMTLGGVGRGGGVVRLARQRER